MITCDWLDGSFYTTVPAPPGCGLVGHVKLAPGVEFETWKKNVVSDIVICISTQKVSTRLN